MIAGGNHTTVKSWQPERTDFSARRRYASEQPPQAALSVYHYIKEYRLEQAAVELVRSDKSVTQIAQNAGYDNASKFSECFKKRYGITPSQYRLRARE